MKYTWLGFGPSPDGDEVYKLAAANAGIPLEPILSSDDQTVRWLSALQNTEDPQDIFRLKISLMFAYQYPYRGDKKSFHSIVSSESSGTGYMDASMDHLRDRLKDSESIHVVLYNQTGKRPHSPLSHLPKTIADYEARCGNFLFEFGRTSLFGTLGISAGSTGTRGYGEADVLNSNCCNIEGIEGEHTTELTRTIKASLDDYSLILQQKRTFPVSGGLIEVIILLTRDGFR